VYSMNIDNYFEQSGDEGTPIVFIHGSYATTSTWKKMVEKLAETHHCISIKLPGHCGTPDPGDFADPSIETELSIIEQVVAEVTDQPIHLVGHSYGGVVALAQALKGSLSLSQLTLYEPVAVWVLDVVGDREMSTRVYNFLKDYRRAAAQQTPYACAQVIDFWGGEGSFEPLPDFVKDTMAPLLENNIRHWDICTVTPYTLTDLKGFLTPTRIVCGGQSNPAAQAIAKHLNELLPNSQKTCIDGASHSMLNTHFDECFAALQDSFGERS
jgi:pimeloyl-ACP methyl ester carboxylesterase